MSLVGAWAAVAVTVLLTVYGQIIIKMRVLQAGAIGSGLSDKLVFLAKIFLDPWVLSGLLGALLAGFSWMAAMTRLPLGVAYPFTSLAFILVVVLSAMLLHETIKPMQLAGIGLVICGLIVVARA
ncbi:EamA family transporter [Dongia soli]|uniref:EamA family transporter n=1 Tax=Dongia soli TaxID=600628 RepID=A0ABU5EDG0_9PROT|nr:EamA family transporter [Dongia soli]MDY0884074.1 EamA family transporter [Dongia soli]